MSAISGLWLRRVLRWDVPLIRFSSARTGPPHGARWRLFSTALITNSGTHAPPEVEVEVEDEGGAGAFGSSGGGGGGGSSGGGGGGGSGGSGGSGGGGGGGGGGRPTPTPTVAGARPGVPESLAISPGDQFLTISWEPPNLSGQEVIVYRLRWRGPGQRYSDSDRTRISNDRDYEPAGLDNGVVYSEQVAAVLRNTGLGPWAQVSAVPRTIPGVPRFVRVVSGDKSLMVMWSAPLDTGGSPIIGYVVRWSLGGVRVGGPGDLDRGAADRRARSVGCNGTGGRSAVSLG